MMYSVLKLVTIQLSFELCLGNSTKDCMQIDVSLQFAGKYQDHSRYKCVANISKQSEATYSPWRRQFWKGMFNFTRCHRFYLLMFILLWFQVWKAEAENICGYDGTVLVAVKTTKEKAPDKEKSDLLQEMQIMQKIGHHPNVVTLLGVSIDKGTVCCYFLYMELSIQYVGWSYVF